MKLGIMQPYFLPYIGYWQLINYVDLFVIYDDVNFIKGGWINRNRILPINGSKYINLPLYKMSSNKLINETEVNSNAKETEKNLNKIKETYKKAPYYNEVFPYIEKIYSSEEKYVSGFIADSLRLINTILNIQTKMIFSSDIVKNDDLHGEEKVIDICRSFGADEYINLIGGIDLYHRTCFSENGIELKFLKANLSPYPQFENEFVPSLSIIDVLMFNGIEDTRSMLEDFTLVTQ